jgi:hypothetical protein
MYYELWVTPGCANRAPALALFQGALVAEGIEVHPRVVDVTSTEQARALEFHGSPSFIAGGRNLFPSASDPALACRGYQRVAGLAGVPSQEDLQAALRSARTAGYR